LRRSRERLFTPSPVETEGEGTAPRGEGKLFFYGAVTFQGKKKHMKEGGKILFCAEKGGSPIASEQFEKKGRSVIQRECRKRKKKKPPDFIAEKGYDIFISTSLER